MCELTASSGVGWGAAGYHHPLPGLLRVEGVELPLLPSLSIETPLILLQMAASCSGL